MGERWCKFAQISQDVRVQVAQLALVGVQKIEDDI